MSDRAVETSPRRKARIAGVLYLFAVLTAVLFEASVRGKWLFVVSLIPISCFVAVTLLLYGIFRPVNRSLSLLMVFFSFVGLSFEALELQPRGVNVALVFHAFYCLLIGYLSFRSNFLPRALGGLMAFGGLAWLTSVSTPLANRLSPYNLAAGFLGEGSLMLWLLVMGVNAQRWKEASEAGSLASGPTSAESNELRGHRT